MNQINIGFGLSKKITAFLETKHCLLFATDSNQLFVFKSDLTLHQSINLPGIVKNLFLINNDQQILCFQETGMLITF